ncbi:hypothetical protein [Desertivirga brevis]|uniref:hypothetical protein n=1 Tax=Desertivirga brevis TaxID=2810310 RepID=UPI001A970A4B|nr:hypothetical protein [Pedobacter sp. SYSU D00873]
MKTLTTIAAAFFMMISLNSFGADKTSSYKVSVSNNAKKFVSSISEGNIEGLKDILDNSLTLRFTRGMEIRSYGKQEVLKALKDAGEVKQDCSVAYQNQENEDGQSTVLISMKYENFTKMTRLTFKDTKKGAMISKIASWYE